MTFNENDIRPDDLMAGQAQRFENDVRRLLSRKSEFVEVPCPACASKDHVPRFEKYGLSYVECAVCDTMYISPRPTPEILGFYYENSENYWYWNKYIFPASESTRREKIFRPRAQRLADACRKFAVQTDMLMEVGAGFGTFGECIRDLELFKRYVCVEPTRDLAATCRSKGFEVIEQPIEQVDLDTYGPSVVASFEVIEHLFSPRDFLVSCLRILRPGGLLVLSCPNGKGFDVDTLGPLSGAVDTEHLNYFNPRSLPHLLTHCGFQILDVSTPGELDAELVRKKVLSGEFAVTRGSFLDRVLVQDWDRLGAPFQHFLATNQLSGHLVVVAQRPLT